MTGILQDSDKEREGVRKYSFQRLGYNEQASKNNIVEFIDLMRMSFKHMQARGR